MNTQTNPHADGASTAAVPMTARPHVRRSNRRRTVAVAALAVTGIVGVMATRAATSSGDSDVGTPHQTTVLPPPSLLGPAADAWCLTHRPC